MNSTRAKAALILTLLASLAARAGPSLKLYAGDATPYSMVVAGRAVGMTTDKLRLALERAGVAYTIELVPYRRGLRQAQTEPLACTYSLTRTPEREADFQWIGPIRTTDWTLYALATRQIVLRDLKDARPYKIGAAKDSARERYLIENGYQVISSVSGPAALRMLVLGRTDLWVNSASRGPVIIEAEKLSGQVVPVLTFKRVELYLACHRDLDAGITARLNAALQELLRDGSADAIERRYKTQE